MPGEITHEKMLEGADEQVIAFTDVISRLGDRLGPILVQPHPRFAHDQLPKLEAFLSHLPKSLRYAVEFRHRSWAGFRGGGHLHVPAPPGRPAEGRHGAVQNSPGSPNPRLGDQWAFLYGLFLNKQCCLSVTNVEDKIQAWQKLA